MLPNKGWPLGSVFVPRVHIGGRNIPATAKGFRLTDARPLTTHVPDETGLDPRSLVGVASDLCRLPAVATQDWADLAADALTGIDRASRVGIMIARLDDSGRLGNSESVSVRVSDLEARRSQDSKKESAAARMRLERMNDLGLSLPSETMTRGLCANAEELGEWRTGPLSRVWDPHTTDALLVSIAPIGAFTSEDGETEHRCILVFVALSPSEPHMPRPGARTLAALVPLLAERAALAMPAGQAISWLTDREQDVLDRLTLGRSVREIAEDLGRSPHTVHDHVKSLHRKLSASSRGELVARALGHNPIPATRLDLLVAERVRASTFIEPTPGMARRVPAN